MSLPRIVRSGTFVSQALISGRVRDSLSDGTPGGLVVRLIDRDSNLEYPLAGRVLADGAFVFYSAPETAFPLLAQKDYQLRVEAEAPNYQSQSVDIDLPAISGQPAPVTRAIPITGIPNMNVRLFTGGGLPRTGLVLSLDRNPVRLHGRVYVSHNPMKGIEDATVTIAPDSIPPGDSVTTDAEGRFEFLSPLPVALEIEIRASAVGFEDNQFMYEPNYNRPRNALLIGLKDT